MLPLNETLRRLREESHMSQSEVAEWLSAHFKPTKFKAVSSWETGIATPSGEYLLYLIELYNVIDVQEIFIGRSGLNAEGLRKLQEYARLLGESPRYTERYTQPKLRKLRFYDIPVSAGYGQFLDDARCECKEVDEWVPSDADYAVRVAGDSMEPRFVNQQWIFVREQDTLNEGDIGIFLYDGEAYCKVLSYDQEHPVLLSLNREYKPLPIELEDTFRVMGKVVG